MPKSNVVQINEVTGVKPKNENENPDSFDVMDCRNNVIDTLDHWGGGGKMFDCHSTLGWTVYFDYNRGDDSQSKRMALKVQPVEEYEQMSALWDMHKTSDDPEIFIKRYAKWYKQYMVPDGVRGFLFMSELRRKEGSDVKVRYADTINIAEYLSKRDAEAHER